MKRTMKIVIAVIFVTLILSALVFDAKNMTGAVVGAVETCLYTIIPALFGFMAVSAYLLKSGLYRILFKPLFLILRYIIKLSEEEFGIFLLSLFGGYPTGAKLLSDNAKPNGERTPLLLAFCYCPSPGFVISVVGIGLFSNPRVGLAVYFSNLLACVLLAIFLNLRNKKSPAKLSGPPLQLSQDVFTSSVMTASSALFPVCAVIVAFGVIGGVLKFIGIEHELLFAILEISNTSDLAPDLSLLPLFAALFSFGGLCILSQVPALTKGRIPLKRFFLWRIPAGFLSAVICWLIVRFADFGEPPYVTVIASRVTMATEAGSPVASAALLIMAVILVKTAGEGKAVY
jgi:hypothetical protein